VQGWLDLSSAQKEEQIHNLKFGGNKCKDASTSIQPKQNKLTIQNLLEVIARVACLGIVENREWN
jgi:hypothetical protein